ncbi:hypothetical protein BPOR_0957g00040 [Botrytis porri]|uniref:Uncharacterized protein n=1 Tax=Botrytis porri TaxID=87229 RepID=A0A4Z1KLA8_9HELO|nr:hypothetical protein BPOR_0957g00040 [Botrytis porri]
MSLAYVLDQFDNDAGCEPENADWVHVGGPPFEPCWGSENETLIEESKTRMRRAVPGNLVSDKGWRKPGFFAYFIDRLHEHSLTNYVV